MKKIVALVLMGLMVFGAVPAFANPLTHEVIDIENGLRVIVNGEELHPKGYSGEDLPMFTYNGNTYLPLRSIANAFNTPIEWDGENNIVYLGTKTAGDTFMTLKRYYESGEHGSQYRIKWYDEHMGADGEMKKNVLYAKPRDIDSISDSEITQTEAGPTMYTIEQCGDEEVVLDGQFKRFTAQLFVPAEALEHPYYDSTQVDFATHAEEAIFEVTAYYMAGTVESEVICEKRIHVGDKPIDIDLDMTNVKYISFYLDEGQSHDGLTPQAMLANPTFWKEAPEKK